MGKFTINFSTSFLKAAQGQIRNGIDFSYIRQAIDALPNETFILSIKEDSAAGLLTVEAENFNIPNGSEAVPKYRTALKKGVLGPSTYVVFDGVDIIDPPLQNNSAGNTYTTVPVTSNGTSWTVGSSTLPLPVNTAIKTVTIQLPTINLKDVKIDLTRLGAAICTCGAEKCGGLHSNWCDKGN